jgi:hypothetical protein
MPRYLLLPRLNLINSFFFLRLRPMLDAELACVASSLFAVNLVNLHLHEPDMVYIVVAISKGVQRSIPQ